MLRAVVVGVPVGLAAGSLAGAALTRWPAGQTLGRPARSRCDACGVLLRPRDLLPVVSWLRLRGRCGECGALQHPGQPALESLGAVLVAAASIPGWSPTGVLLAVVGVAVALAAGLDLERRWIPDRLTLPLAAVVLPVALALAVTGPAAVGPVVLAGLGVPAALAAVRAATAAAGSGPWLGGGDVKLLVSVLAAAALVPGGVLAVAAGSLVAGGAVASVGLLTRRLRRGARLPLAPFLLVGWFAVLAVAVTGVPT